MASKLEVRIIQKQNFGRALRKIMTERNLSLRELCVAMGMTKNGSFVGNIVRGEAKARPATVERIEKALELKPGKLAKYYNVVPPSSPAIVPAKAMQQLTATEEKGNGLPEVTSGYNELDDSSWVKREGETDTASSSNIALNGLLVNDKSIHVEGILVFRNNHDPDMHKLEINMTVILARKRANQLIKLLTKLGVVSPGSKIRKG